MVWRRLGRTRRRWQTRRGAASTRRTSSSTPGAARGRPFNLSKSGSLVARGYAAGGGASGPDRGRYWTTAARLEYLAAVDRDAVADADVDEDLDLVDAAADADNDDHDDAFAAVPVPDAAAAVRCATLGHARGANFGRRRPHRSSGLPGLRRPLPHHLRRREYARRITG